MSSLDEEASQRAQHILDLPHEKKNMSVLVTTSTLKDAGFLSPTSVRKWSLRFLGTAGLSLIENINTREKGLKSKALMIYPIKVL